MVSDREVEAIVKGTGPALFAEWLFFPFRGQLVAEDCHSVREVDFSKFRESKETLGCVLSSNGNSSREWPPTFAQAVYARPNQTPISAWTRPLLIARRRAA